VIPNFSLNEPQILAFALILLRMSTFLVAWPVFSIYSVPQPLKILMALVITIVIFPVVNRSGLSQHTLDHDLVWLAGKEVLTGLCLGFLTRLYFFALGVGGNFIATSTGLANGQVFNPAMNTQTTTLEQFYSILGTLLFLSVNGHHIFLTGIVQSFDAIPLSLAGIEFAPFKECGPILQSVTEAGIKIAAPVMVSIFMTNIAMGVLGRAVPQINVLVTSMPVNFMTGMLVMIIGIPALLFQLDHDLIAFANQMFQFMKAM
jgi:flagellar biosynthetic protein FliR